jgi:hypothetical protein
MVSDIYVFRQQLCNMTVFIIVIRELDAFPRGIDALCLWQWILCMLFCYAEAESIRRRPFYMSIKKN